MNADDRRAVVRARLAGRDGLADEIELAADRDEVEIAAREQAPLGDVDAGRGEPQPYARPVSLAEVAAAARAEYDESPIGGQRQ